MYQKPIQPMPLKNMEELMKFSYRMYSIDVKLKFCCDNRHIGFADQNGELYVTPYRDEITSILKENGYTAEFFFLPFSDGSPSPHAYFWLEKIAEEENWAVTYAKAYQIATCEKDIKPVVLGPEVDAEEIYYFNDKENSIVYKSMVHLNLEDDTAENIGTFILQNAYQLVVCDEYGRTFILSSKNGIKDVANTLINAGYTRTPHPEKYIVQYDPKTKKEIV